MSTKIEWTNFLPGYSGESWNIVTGCNEASRGCQLCYARGMSHRLTHIGHSKEKYKGTTKKSPGRKIQWTGLVKTHENLLTKPSEWKNPRVVFVCSMSDLFHKDVPFEFINAAYSVMADNRQHKFLILTKRPDRMVEFQEWKSTQHGIEWWPSDNIWHGTSVEDQEQANKRLPWLFKVRGKIRFLSCEPLLGPIELIDIATVNAVNHLFGDDYPPYYGIQWVIAGGESGSDAQPMHISWVRSLRDQCKNAGVPFFFKQWGEWAIEQADSSINAPFMHWVLDTKVFHYLRPDGQHKDFSDMEIDFQVAGSSWMAKVGKSKSGRQLDNLEHNEYPPNT